MIANQKHGNGRTEAHYCVIPSNAYLSNSHHLDKLKFYSNLII